MKKTFINLIIVYFYTFSALALAANDNRILQTAFFEDVSSQINIDQIQHHDFILYEGLLSKGYTSSAYWVRLEVKREAINKPHVLRVLPTYLDDIEVYQKLNGKWTKKVTGDQHAFNDREYLNTAFGVQISPEIEDRYLYLRLKTTSINMLSTELVDEKTFNSLEGRRDFAIGGYFGTACIIFFFVLFFYVKKTSYLLKEFGFFLMVEIAFIFSLLGYTSRFIFPANPSTADFSVSLIMVLFVFSVTLFHRNFIKKEVPVKWILWAMNTCLIISLGLITWIFFTENIISILRINQIIGLILGILFGCIPLAFVLTRNVTKYVAIVYGLLSLSVLSAILPNLGLINAIEYNLYATSYTGLLSSILIASLLIQKQRTKELASIHQDNQLLLAKQELLFEKNLRERQNKFLTMLAHEMRTPLSVLKLVINNNAYDKLGKHAERAINDMNQIIERCVQMDKVENASELIKKTDFDPMQAAGEIIHRLIDSTRLDFKVFNPVAIIHSDETFFNIIITNLIENAVKYSAPDSMIQILMDSITLNDKNYWRIIIINQVGKAGQPDTEMLFNKFYRSSKARNISGSGLGLFLVKSLTNVLEGHINYTPMNQSVKFELCLPF